MMDAAQLQELYRGVSRPTLRYAKIKEHPTGLLVVEGPLMFDETEDAKDVARAVPPALGEEFLKRHKRTNGDVLCDACGEPYRKHPKSWPITHEHVACDGRLLHL